MNMLTNRFFAYKAISLGALALTTSCLSIPRNNELWKVPAQYDRSQQPQRLAWQQLPGQAVKVDTAADDGRKFSYYPYIYNVGGTLYLLFSASAEDVDGMGQDVRISTSVDGGITWTKPTVAFPPALLPNQTEVHDSRYWCDRGIPQRALQPLTIAFLPGGGEGSSQVFAVAQSSDNICPGSFQSAGRIARELDVHGSGLFKGDPCWIETNDYTGAHEWAETVYGTQYQMKVCDNKDIINAAISQSDNLGPVATKLFDSPLIAADTKHNVSYPTAAVWTGDENNGFGQRFWSDVSVANSTSNSWVQYSAHKNGDDWYPATPGAGTPIYQTNIYQSTPKAHFGSFSGATQLRYLILNSGMTAALDQELLVLATSRGDDLSFYGVGVVRGGDASKPVARGTRGDFNSGVPGFYWPSAASVGDAVAVAYSENRQVIWVSVIQEHDLP